MLLTNDYKSSRVSQPPLQNELEILLKIKKMYFEQEGITY